MRGFMVVPVEPEGPNFRCVGATVGRVFAAITHENNVLFEVEWQSTVKEAGAEVIGGVERMKPTVHGPVFRRSGAQRWRRLEYP